MLLQHQRELYEKDELRENDSELFQNGTVQYPGNPHRRDRMPGHVMLWRVPLKGGRFR